MLNGDINLQKIIFEEHCFCYRSSWKNQRWPLIVNMVRHWHSNPIQLPQSKLKVKDVGKHLQGADDLLQQHAIQDAQLQALSKRVRALNRKSSKFGTDGGPEANLLQNKLEELNGNLKKWVLHALEFILQFKQIFIRS